MDNYITFCVKFLSIQFLSLLSFWQEVLSSCLEGIASDWDFLSTLPFDTKYVFQIFLRGLIIMEENKGSTYIFDRSDVKPYLIAMVFEESILLPDSKEYIWKPLEQLYAAHHVTERGRGKKSLETNMIEIGPFFHS